MEPAREITPPEMGDALSNSVERNDHPLRHPDAVVLQVDATVSGIDGLAWLTNRRDADTAHRLTQLQRGAAAEGWSWADLTRGRLKTLRPRRAEINELGAAYLAALTPGVVEAVSAMRRAGIAISLSSDVAAEGLFGVATALGVSPNELHAPRLRFDAIGAYVGCDLSAATALDVSDAPRLRSGASTPRIVFVGTRRSEMFAPRGTDSFVAFSGVVAREGRADAKATVASFRELTALVLR